MEWVELCATTLGQERSETTSVCLSGWQEVRLTVCKWLVRAVGVAGALVWDTAQEQGWGTNPQPMAFTPPTSPPSPPGGRTNLSWLPAGLSSVVTDWRMQYLWDDSPEFQYLTPCGCVLLSAIAAQIRSPRLLTPMVELSWPRDGIWVSCDKHGLSKDHPVLSLSPSITDVGQQPAREPPRPPWERLSAWLPLAASETIDWYQSSWVSGLQCVCAVCDLWLGVWQTVTRRSGCRYGSSVCMPSYSWSGGRSKAAFRSHHRSGARTLTTPKVGTWSQSVCSASGHQPPCSHHSMAGSSKSKPTDYSCGRSYG